MIVKFIKRIVMENIALRQQLMIYKRSSPKPRIRWRDRFFWVLFTNFHRRWNRVLFIVQPETVIKWHRTGYKIYWRYISRPKNKPGQKPIDKGLRELISKMVADNPRISRRA